MLHYRQKKSESTVAQCKHCYRWAPTPRYGPAAAVLYRKRWKQTLMDCSGMGEKGVNHLFILVHTGSTEQYHDLSGIASFIIFLINAPWSEDKALMFLNKWLLPGPSKTSCATKPSGKGLVTTEYIALC